MEAKEFDDAFYEFRVAVRELERRLASVLTQGLDDARTTSGKLKLLDSFDALVHRAAAAEELEKKYVELVLDYGKDIKQMQALFLRQRDAPPIASNLPPLAGALTWCRGLLERVQHPMKKLKQLEKRVMECEEARLVIRDYTTFLGQLSDYERSQIAAWGDSVEASSQAKLKNSLLMFEQVESTSLNVDAKQQPDRACAGLLHVNFDPMLTRLLREVKYFLLLGFEAPSSALEIYQHAEIFRRHIGNLDLIVNMYNWIQTNLLPVERPLLRSELDSINKMLAQGICSSPGMTLAAASPRSKTTALNWKSSNIEHFINEAMAEVKELMATITVMKSNLRRVEELLAGCSHEPLIKRSGKPATISDFEQLQKVTLAHRYGQVRECGITIHALIRDSNKKLKVSTGLPDWKSYVDFVNNIVIAGLKTAVINSCVKLEQQLDPAYLTKHNPGPMLEIEVDLLDKDVRYVPEYGFFEEGRDNPDKRGLKNHFRHILENFVEVGTTIQRLDATDGSYVRELSEDPHVKSHFAAIEGRLTDTAVQVEKLRRQFEKYEYLWNTDLHDMFNNFLDTAFDPLDEAVQSVEASLQEDSQVTSADGTDTQDDSTNAPCDDERRGHDYAPKEVLRLDLFDEKIRHYLEIQAEIEELKAVHEIDFLRIVCQPIKQALGTWVTKWMFMFTNYLQTSLIEGLNELYEFIAHIDKGLDKTVSPGDKDTLLEVMNSIRDIRKRMPVMEETLEPLRNIVGLLKTHGIALDIGTVGDSDIDALRFLEGLPMRWDIIVNKTFRVKESIQPTQNAMVDTIRKDVADYIERVMHVYATFHGASEGPFTWKASCTDEAYCEINRAHAQLEILENEAEGLNNLQELFELNPIRIAQLIEMRVELKMLKHVWDMIGLVKFLFSHWRHTPWTDIDSDDLLDQTKKLLLQVKQLPRRVRDWACYTHLQASVINMSAILPVVAEMLSPAMRERHWKAVAATTGKPIEKGPNFSLGDLLALDIDCHVDVIMEIVETANKENKVEKKLFVIEKFWSDACFEFADLHDATVDNSAIKILVFPDEVIEVLNEHHIQLQSMASLGRSVEFFSTKLTHWQSALGNIEVIMRMLLAVQRSWASLESIFLLSQDIRNQLPEQIQRFEAVHADFKALMQSIVDNPNIVNVCCETDGQEAALASMHRELELCQKALTE